MPHMRHLRPIILSFCLTIAAAAAEPVVIGGGSYAPAGANVIDGDGQKVIRTVPCVEPELKDRPMPTNDWWTTLLTGPFPGKMYAMPATIDATPAGARVWFPQGWNQNGTELEAGRPLEINAVDPSPAKVGGDVIVAAFDGDGWPAGWTTSGNAFGSGPTAFAKRAMANAVGRGYACSFVGQGDRGTGELTSPVFTIDRDHLHVQVGGGRDDKQTYVALEVDGKVVRTAAGRNSNDFAWITWPVKEWRGKNAKLKAVDIFGGGWGFIALGRAVLSDQASPSSGGLLTGATVARWGDWTVTMRLKTGTGKALDATFGHGSPYVWFECNGLDLAIPSDGGAVSEPDGKPVTGASKGDTVVIERDNRVFALIAPPKATFTVTDGVIVPKFAGKERFVVLALAPDRAALPLLRKHAYVVPRDSRLAWTHKPEAGEVATTWTITADVVAGTERTALQGWLPHHWRSGRTSATFAEPTYRTQRGTLKLAAANSVEIAWPFVGLLPLLPAPTGNATSYAYDAMRMADLIQKWTDDRVAKGPGKAYGEDTYWGGKDVVLLAEYYSMAKATGHPATDRLKELITECLANWFTWKPGEQAHYFAKYPAPWSALVGQKTSFGSGSFTDNHFHFGYFTHAAALLMKDDPEFTARFAPITRLIAKQYANWERDDKDFPFLRCFDPWNGHSYAGGLSDRNDGNNQESSSEAMQSWAGLFLLGAAIGDDAMRATGAMGYAIEEATIIEYWNDYHRWKSGEEASNYSPNYTKQHPIVSVLRDRDIGYWTWFSGEPIHIFGIQWLPQWTYMQYLARDPKFTAWQVNNMLTAQGKGTPVTFSKLGDDWGNVALGAMQFGDNELVAKLLDEAGRSGDPLGGWKRAGVTYYLTHAYRSLGRIAWDASCSLPTSTVFEKDGKLTVVAWNPGKAPMTVKVHRAGKAVGQVSVPAGALQAFPLP
jgi:hypothetical protein